MENKWMPCFCTILLGVAVIVFTWWRFSWSDIALTVLGALVIVKGIVNSCCCSSIAKNKSSCCG